MECCVVCSDQLSRVVRSPQLPASRRVGASVSVSLIMSGAYKYQQTSVYGVCEEEMNGDSKCSCFWDYLIPFTRFWGLLTSVGECFFLNLLTLVPKHNIQVDKYYSI